jgi:hypothetical protein
MNCTCNCLSPFKWASYPRDSIFMGSSLFYKGASSGTTMSALQTAAVERYAARTGRSAGSIHGISDRGDAHIEQSNYRRARRAA